MCVLVQVTSCVGKSCIEEDRQLPPTDWPKDGSIAFDNVFFDYCDGAPCALNGISCTIESGQKIGVCGRTGAGAQQNTIVDLRHLYANLCGIIIVDLVTRRVCCVCTGKSTLLSVLFSLGPLKTKTLQEYRATQFAPTSRLSHNRPRYLMVCPHLAPYVC